MDIYEYAMQLERDGERYYRELVEKVANAGLKNILSMLADAEVRHYEIFRRMRQDDIVEVSDTPILSEVKNIFVEMRERGESVVSDGSEVDLYERAQEIELKTQNFYLEKAREVKDPARKEIFLKVADEERRHYLILENVIDFVARPFSWLENAEWYHLEEY
ncbi:MAG TPA: ferritin family protein [Dissulfurispiraceae bacterium]